VLRKTPQTKFWTAMRSPVSFTVANLDMEDDEKDASKSFVDLLRI